MSAFVFEPVKLLTVSNNAGRVEFTPIVEDPDDPSEPWSHVVGTTPRNKLKRVDVSVELRNEGGFLSKLILKRVRRCKHCVEFCLPFDAIDAVELIAIHRHGYPLWLRTKTFLVLIIVFPDDEVRRTFSRLVTEGLPRSYDDLPCFRSSNSTALGKQLTDGSGHDQCPENTLQDCTDDSSKETGVWRRIPSESFCRTYPRMVTVPSKSLLEAHQIYSLSTIEECASFRSNGRIPVRSYFHAANGASLCRSSQPLVGFSGSSLSDERHLKNIAQALEHVDTDEKRSRDDLFIADLRPKLNAVANRAQGKGYESERRYKFVQYQFMGVENIHKVRESMMKMCPHLVRSPGAIHMRDESESDVINRMLFSISKMERLLATFDIGVSASPRSGELNAGLYDWLRHISSLLTVAEQLSRRFTHNVTRQNILVHCSDGWDRTSQICSLVRLLIQPDGRTIHGLHRVIREEWMDFGFQFSLRCGHLNTKDDPETKHRQRAPIFLQFLDALYQLIHANPTCFQFNEKLLVCLHEESMCARYFDFVGNYQREREAMKCQVKGLVPCFWSEEIYKREDWFLNTLYDEARASVRVPKLDECRRWSSLFDRYTSGELRLNNRLMVDLMSQRVERLRRLVDADVRPGGSGGIGTRILRPLRSAVLSCHRNHLIIDQHTLQITVCDRCTSVVCSECSVADDADGTSVAPVLCLRCNNNNNTNTSNNKNDYDDDNNNNNNNNSNENAMESHSGSRCGVIRSDQEEEDDDDDDGGVVCAHSTDEDYVIDF